MKKIVICMLLCAAMSTSLFGCSSGKATATDTDQETAEDEATEEATETPTETVTETPEESEEAGGETAVSEDGVYQVTLPKGWSVSEDKQEDGMNMEFQGPSDDQYAGIMTVDKASVGNMDIAAYMDSYAQGAAEQFENSSIGEKIAMDVNGKAAYYMVLTGKVENVSYVNWVYVIDATDKFYIATAGAYPTNSEAAEVAFQELVYSFTEVNQQAPAQQ